MTGFVLWAFFLLGVMTGFSGPGRRLISRASVTLGKWTDRAFEDVRPLHALADYFGQSLIPTRYAKGEDAVAPRLARVEATARPFPVALVERPDGFYALLANGELSGPVSPSEEPDVAILSGSGVQTASPDTLVRYAATLVRAEAHLSRLISEMHVSGDGTAALFLDRTRTEILIDLSREPRQIARAARVLDIWRGRARLLAMVDMTTPGLAVLRFNRKDLSRAVRRAAALNERGGDSGLPRLIAEAGNGKGLMMR